MNHKCIYCGKPVEPDSIYDVCSDCWPNRFELEESSGFIGIKSKVRSDKYGEVFTPFFMVDAMLNLLEAENERPFDIHKTFLDPACGTGAFPLQILYRKLLNCQSIEDGLIALKSIYCIDIQLDNVEETRYNLYMMFKERFGDSEEAKSILEQNIVWGNMLTGRYEDTGEKIWFLIEDCDEYWAYVEELQKKEAKKKKKKG